MCDNTMAFLFYAAMFWMYKGSHHFLLDLITESIWLT